MLELLYLVDLLLHAHLSEPEALVDAPLLEHALHLLLAFVLGGRVALRALARLGQDDHLVYVFLPLDDVLVRGGDRSNLGVDVVLGLGIVEE